MNSNEWWFTVCSPNFWTFSNIGFGDNFLVGTNQSSGGLLIGNALPRNSDRQIVLSRATCSLRLFSCKTTKAKINVYFQRFEVRKKVEKQHLNFRAENPSIRTNFWREKKNIFQKFEFSRQKSCNLDHL